MITIMTTQIISSPIAGCMRWGVWGAGFTFSEYLGMIEACLENDITCFDHADIYGGYTTEEEFGQVLKRNPSFRRQMKLITKCGIKMTGPNRPDHSIKSYDTSRNHIISSVERSLENFGTDHIDVLLIHRPDPLLDPAEVAGTIELLKKQGKVLAFGVSNFLPHQVDLLASYTQLEFNQLEVSVMQPAPFINGTLENCMKHTITPMAWAPLGGGVFTDDSHPRSRSIMTTANELAEKYNTGLNEILLAWLHTHPSGILSVIGTTKIERLIQAKAAAAIRLSREDWFKLLAASIGSDVA